MKIKNLCLVIALICCGGLLGCNSSSTNLIYNFEKSELSDFQTYFENMLMLVDEAYNAGEVYGLTALLYETSGIGEMEDVYTDEELATFFSNDDNLYLLDFTLPMLEDQFFDQETVTYVQDAAISFIDYCVEEYGMKKTCQFCEDTSEKGRAKLVALKNEWLTEIGATTTYEEYGKLPFAYNYNETVPGYPYVLISTTSKWYFSPIDVKECGYCEFVDEYMKIISAAEEDFADAREVLKEVIPENLSDVNIYTKFYEIDEVSAGAIYIPEREAMYLYEDWRFIKDNILHEYVHHLTHGEGKVFPLNEKGLLEGATEAIARFECENRLEKMYDEDMFSDEIYGEENQEFAKEIGAWDLDTNQFNGEIYYYYLAKYYYEAEPLSVQYRAINQSIVSKPTKVTLNEISYYEAGSMAKYLMEQYGLEETLKNCTNIISIQKMTGKTFSELYEDWGKWNEQRYQELKIEYFSK